MNREGTSLKELVVAPDGPAGKPQWSPDDRFIFLHTFPYTGRRIIVVDTVSWQVVDLTQPLWDAIFTLAPDGQSLLLTNGRGGLWQSHLSYTIP